MRTTLFLLAMTGAWLADSMADSIEMRCELFTVVVVWSDELQTLFLDECAIQRPCDRSGTES